MDASPVVVTQHHHLGTSMPSGGVHTIKVAQRASTHARVLDHTGSGGGSRYRTRPCCLPCFRTRRHPGCSSFRGSMAGLCAPLPTLRRHPRECQRTAQGRCGSLLLHRGGLSPPTPCRSSRRTESQAGEPAPADTWQTAPWEHHVPVATYGVYVRFVG